MPDFTHFVHPDLHFVFPIIKYKTAESSVCDVYIDAWRKRLQAGLYFDLNDWLGDMKAEKPTSTHLCGRSRPDTAETGT